MTEIRIDTAKAERMISQILREEKHLLPADAKALAAKYLSKAHNGDGDTDKPTFAQLPDYPEHTTIWHGLQ
jgi:hypothetical protein